MIPPGLFGTLFQHVALAPSCPLFLLMAARPVQAVFLPAWFPLNVWIPYLLGAFVLILGLVRLLNREFLGARAMNQIAAVGPVLLAAATAVFGVEHFLFAPFVARMVPTWIPGHMFWALVTGVCFVAASFSIAVRRYAGLSAALLALMLLLFILLIHLPDIFRSPGNRLVWIVAFRDLAFSGGALAVAALQIDSWEPLIRQRFITLARFFLGLAAVVLGFEQFLHPELAPGVPLARLTPTWIPGHLFWPYLAGIVFLVAGIALMLNKEVRVVATTMGLTILLLVLIVYVPMVVANPWDIENGLNYLADALLLGGSALALAGARRANFPLEYLADRKVFVVRHAEAD